MLSVRIMRGTKGKEMLWALICIVNFVGTIQQSTTDSTEASPTSMSPTSSDASTITATETTGSTTTDTRDPLTTETPSSEATYSTLISTAGAKTDENGSQTITTHLGVTSPSATMPDVSDNSTTTTSAGNENIGARLQYDNSTTIVNQTSSSATTQPATTALPPTPSTADTQKTGEVVMLVVTCLPNKDFSAEKDNCLQFKSPITCEEFKNQHKDIITDVCNYLNVSGRCHLNFSQSENDKVCLLLSHDTPGKKSLRSDSMDSLKEVLKQHDVELTSAHQDKQTSAHNDKTISGQEDKPPSKPKTTLIALVTTGLVVTALILCGYFLSNRQSWSPGSRRLDEDYAGNDSPDNTLISVANYHHSGQPDKQSLKGGSQENGTGQAITPAATNGHSNKQHVVADTEL